jgi:hypothetical protein
MPIKIKAPKIPPTIPATLTFCPPPPLSLLLLEEEDDEGEEVIVCRPYSVTRRVEEPTV